ncbi:hypothetical protein GTW43_24800 [Streptomyces sp. SID5785]|nr:hypothetical protein [Streptomyces sp. SID5785]
MRLNQAPGDQGGGGLQGPYLASTPAEKKKAAKSIEETIEPGTRTAGDLADESTGAAVKEFGPKDGDGWATSGALKSAHTTWGEQVQALMTRLGGEKQSLRATNTLFGGTDHQVGGRAQQVPSPLTGY